ncbi:MAG: reverse transcriptase domain-containing protein [Minisyncoccota bacterium]
MIRSRRGKMRLGGACLRRIQFTHPYEDIISVENLLAAWREFVRGKRKKADVQEFQYALMDNILALHLGLKEGTYTHGGYEHFRISDPKPRDIHKASVRDRLLHRALYRTLYPLFDRTFIADSYSCRRGKGTHKAMNRFREFAYKVSRNHTRTCWVLKCDIRKFFVSIDQKTLIDIVSRYIPDERINALIAEVVGSFSTTVRRLSLGNGGLPLGNLTSQLLVNIYMNEFDQYVKHRLKARYYVRYADDFVLLSVSRSDLDILLSRIDGFLRERLKLELHPNKVFIKTLASGVDFLGWVHFPDHRVLRTATKRRMLRTLDRESSEASKQSYLGMLGHGNARKLQRTVADATMGR